MSPFNFVSYHGHNFKLPEVTYVGPLVSIEHNLDDVPISHHRFEVVIGGAKVWVMDNEKEKVESIRRSLMTSLAVDEPVDPSKMNKLNKFSKSIIRPEDEDYNKA